MKKSVNNESANKSNTTATKRTRAKAAEPAAAAPATLTKGAMARRQLHELTATLRAQHPGAAVNRLLIDYYKSQGATELRTYEEWSERGKQVRKGAKAYAIWGKSEPSTTREGALYFPLKYVFDAAQCIDKPKAQA